MSSLAPPAMEPQMPDLNFALLWTEGAYSTDGKIMGRQSAGAGLVRAIAARSPQALVCATPTSADAQSCARALAAAGAPGCKVEWSPLWGDGAAVRKAGALYRPDPTLAREGWRRAPRGGAAYSCIGVTHTLTTASVQKAISDFLTAPVEPWDALVCTSAAARAVVRRILDATAEHLRRRLGATRLVEPQLPVIPLGVHPEDFVFADGERERARAALGVAPEEIVVLYAGRLTPVKAGPAAMLLALERAAKGRPVVLVQAGVFADPRMHAGYQADAARLSPSIRALFVDGSDAAAYRNAWACADIFTSLADSYQETFGITPLEAMAAALPVVVSDWDGYRDTVRHGIDGLRIPTLTLPPDRMGVFSEQHAEGYNALDRFLLQTGAYVAVDVGKAAEAFEHLFASPEARRRMGAAGLARVRSEFAWNAILQRYVDLADDLARLRPAALEPRPGDPAAQSIYSTFSSYPTTVIENATRLRRRPSAEARLVERMSAFSAQVVGMTPPEALLRSVLAATSPKGWSTFAEIASRTSLKRREAVEAAAVWLVKFDLLELHP